MNPYRGFLAPKYQDNGTIESGDKMNTSHAISSCVTSSKGNRDGIWDELCNLSGSGRNFKSEQAKIIKKAVHDFGKTKAGSSRAIMSKCYLEG